MGTAHHRSPDPSSLRVKPGLANDFVALYVRVPMTIVDNSHTDPLASSMGGFTDICDIIHSMEYQSHRKICYDDRHGHSVR